MKAQLKVRPNLIVEVEGETEADLFENISSSQEVFEHEKCGYCSNTDLRFVVRQDDEENKYYELHCRDAKCRARLPFGQMKKPKGSLYPKRKFDSLSPSEKEQRQSEKTHADSHYGYLDHNGWYKYKKPENK
jgi:hypothetical protein